MSRSMVRIVGVALAGGLAFVAWMLVPALFMAIPWPIRWWMGMATFLGLGAALVGWTLRASPPRPWRLVDPSTTPQQGVHRAVAWGLRAVALSFAYPFFARPGYGAVFDWDLHLAWFEALRHTVLRYHQFPWWNPWCVGGFPLAFEPQVGLVSLDTLFVLPFGTETGLKLAAVGSILLATEGARRLARHLWADPWAVALVAAVYAWNGAILTFTVSGHALTLCHPFFPWMILYALHLDRGVRPAAKLGVASAASVLTIIQYPTAYAAAITAGILAWGFLAQPRGARARYLTLLGVAAGVFLALAGWRVVMTGLVLRDFPRVMGSLVDNPIYYQFHSLVDREVPEARIRSHTPSFHLEQACYVGAIPLWAAVVSLRRGWRWWHTIAAVGFAMAAGSISLLHPSYWVQTWPGFSSMHMVGRWRLCAVLGLGLAAADEVRTWPRGLAAALVLAVVADLAVYAHQSLPSAFGIPPAERLIPDRPAVPTIVNLESWEDYGDPFGFEATRKGFGVVRGFCPSLGYNRGRRTGRLWEGNAAYVGEFASGGRAVTPESWSPNRIVFDPLAPGQAVEVNQNPSSFWLANGRRLFPGARCAEPLQPFVAQADDRGRLVLEIAPPGVGLAVGASAMGLVVALVAAALAGRLPGPAAGSGGG